jgi:hypothetical protein
LRTVLIATGGTLAWDNSEQRILSGADLASRFGAVLATRCDPAPLPEYDSVVLRAGDLTAEKAAIALMVALGTTSDMSSIRRWWSELLDG